VDQGVAVAEVKSFLFGTLFGPMDTYRRVLQEELDLSGIWYATHQGDLRYGTRKESSAVIMP